MNAMTIVDAKAAVSRTVATGLGQLHVLDTGAGHETIVLWPSIFTDHRIYSDLVAQLGGSYRFLLIDGPAHGQSGGGEAEFTMDACAKAVAKVMDHFGLNRVIVGGTSWGGMAAAHLALANPDRVKALIMMNTPMEIGATRPGLQARFIASGARWMLSSNAFRNGVANSFFTSEVLAANRPYACAFHDMLKTADPKRMSAAIRSVLLRGSPLLPHMANLSCPTLVIAGKEDVMYPMALQAEAALLAPRGHFAPVGGKHISVVERPNEVAAHVDEFVMREVVQ